MQNLQMQLLQNNRKKHSMYLVVSVFSLKPFESSGQLSIHCVAFPACKNVSEESYQFVWATFKSQSFNYVIFKCCD